MVSARNNVERSKVGLERSKVLLNNKIWIYKNVLLHLQMQRRYKVIQICCNCCWKQDKGAVDYAKERYNVGLMNSFDYNQAQKRYL
jgi:outer membrane protein